VSLVKYNNNSISAVTSAASIPSGSLVPIKTLTASSSATLSFVHGTDGVVLDSTYPIYKFEFINIHPATDTANLTFQSSTDGGSSYGVTATSSSFRTYHDESDTDTSVSYDSSQDLAQSTSFASLGRYEGNDNDQNAGGHLTLFNPSSNTFVKHWLTVYTESFASNYTNTTFTGGYFNSTNPINAIQFKYSSGNIDSGKIKLYGIKDS
jgi:hypothetical protein